VSGAVELVGTSTLRDTLQATAVHGPVRFTGRLSDQWTVPDFYSIDYLPSRGVAHGVPGEANDLPAAVLQRFLDAVAAGVVTVAIGRTYRFDDIQRAHAGMESGAVTGELGVVVDWSLSTPRECPPAIG
jgi:NADPH2:quinone reductase